MMSKALLYAFAGLPALGVAAFLGLPSLENAGKPEIRYTYETAPVTRGTVQRLVRTTGTVSPLRTVQIGSQLSGRIKSLHADFNGHVKAGSVLAIIDPETFEARVKQADADLDAAKSVILQHKASMKKAEAVLQNTKENFARQKTLARKRLAVRSILSNARRDLSVARAEIDLMKANIENAKALVAQKTASLEQKRIDLERTLIRTPIDGIVILRQVDVGQTVAANFHAPELFKIAGDLRKIQIEANVHEADIGLVKTKQPVTFSVDAYPDDVFTGRVGQIRLSPNVHKTVVTYVVIIEAENNARKLFPGMTANLVIETARRDNVLRLPADAMRFKLPRLAKTAKRNESSAEKKKRRMKKYGRKVKKLLKQAGQRLKLSDNQTASAEAVMMKRLNAQYKSFKQYGQRWAHLEAALVPTLSAKQLVRFEAWSKKRSKSKKIKIWVLAGTEKPKRQKVKVGLVDTKYAELKKSKLREGDLVIVRSRRVKKQ